MDNNIEKHIEEICIKANNASKSLSHASSKSKNQALQLIARHIKKDKNDILKANSLDIETAKENNISVALLDRLLLNESRIMI